MKIEATENQLARLFKESERTIRDKYKQARIAPGKYNLINVIETYVSNIKKTISKDEIEEIEKNYKKSKVALNEAKLKIIEEEYISIDEVTEAVSTMIFNFKSKIMSLPKKIVIDLKKCTTSFEQEKTIERHVKKALGELKEYLELHHEGD